MTSRPLSHRKKPAVFAALIASGALFLSACSGSVGAASDAEESGEGFAYNADQAEVDAVLENLSERTITFQTAAPSPDSLTAPPALNFKEEVEARSGGKLTVDIAWGMSVAGYREALDAIQDGRLDISYVLPPYDPQRFPEASEVGAALASVEYSPLAGELVGYAVGSAIGWNDDMFLDPFRDEGVTPLQPVVTSGAYSLNCTEPVVSISDITGKQVRIGTAPQADSAAHMGGVPTSMEFTETFEALQRGTVDCAFTQATTAVVSGLLEVAPHVAHLEDTRMNSVYTGGTLAGSSFANLPLPYQQIVFDGGAALLNGNLQMVMQASADTVTVSQEAGGGVRSFEPDAADAISSALDVAADNLITENRLPSDIEDTIRTATEDWTAVVSEMGYTDGGTYEELPDWYDRDTDFSDLANAVFEATAVPHRPGS